MTILVRLHCIPYICTCAFRSVRICYAMLYLGYCLLTVDLTGRGSGNVLGQIRQDCISWQFWKRVASMTDVKEGKYTPLKWMSYIGTTYTKWCQRHTLQKLVAVVWHQKLARVSDNLVQVLSGTSFLHAIEQSSILARNCPARDTNRVTWLARELFWCKKLWWTCVKLFVQVSGKFLRYQFLVHVSPALRTKQNVLLLLVPPDSW